MRTMDVPFLNGLANHPEIRPFIGGGSAPLDFGPIVQDRRNICLRHHHGATVFIPLEPRRYELHTLIPPEERGRDVLAFAQLAFRYMFAATDCIELVTKVPAPNKRADLMARKVGFVESFTRPAAWEDGSDITYFALTLDRWIGLDEQALEQGRAFHSALEAAKIASGSETPTHPDDDSHDRAAGFAVMMATAGNYQKCVWSYNRWARFAGYQTIELVSETPPLIDVKDALMTVQNGLVEVVACRLEH